MICGANRTISTFRLVNASGSDKTTEYSAVATLTGVGVYIESNKPELDLVLGTKPGVEAYTMSGDALDLTDIRVGDKVTDDKSNTFFVQGIKRYEDNDDTSNHLEVLIHKETVRYTD